MKLIDALDLRGGEMISLCGGGGKTTTLFHLGRELKDKKVLLTTTTKIFVPPQSKEYDIILKKDEGELIEILGRRETNKLVICAPSEAERPDKLRGCSLPFTTAVKPLFDHVIIEADGSAGRPIKAPAHYEPVVSPDTDIYIGLIGLNSLGMTGDDACAHRVPLFEMIRGKSADKIVTVEDLAALINSPVGLFKEAPPHCRKMVLLNKADLLSKEIRTTLMSSLLPLIGGCERVMINSYLNSDESVLEMKILE